MTIRSWHFDGYRLAFGYIYADFLDMGMQRIGGYIDEESKEATHPKNRSGSIISLTYAGLEKEIAHRKDMGYVYEYLEVVLKKWPTSWDRFEARIPQPRTNYRRW